MTSSNHTPYSAIITVGDEILGGFTQDTNAQWLAARLFARGFPPRGMEVVGDRADDIVAAVRRWVARPEVARIFLCGGLGPTPDDRTFAALAQALGRPLVYLPATGRRIQEMVLAFAKSRRLPSGRLGPASRKMATVPAGGTALINPVGMAPSMVYALAEPDRWLLVLPGIPRELKAIFVEEIEPKYLAAPSSPPVVAELHYEAAPESAFYAVMQEVEAAFPGVSVGSYPDPERRELTIRVRGSSAEAVERVVERLRRGVPYQPSGDVGH